MKRVLGKLFWAVLALVTVMVALGGVAASAGATVPRLGRWEGHAGRARVLFTVEQNAQHTRYVVRPVFYCGPYAHWDVENGVIGPSIDAWPISAGTAFLPAPANPQYARPPFVGRFDTDRGTFTVDPVTLTMLRRHVCPGVASGFTARWVPAALIVPDGFWKGSLRSHSRAGVRVHVQFSTLGAGSLIENAWSVSDLSTCHHIKPQPGFLGLLVGADGSFQVTRPGSRFSGRVLPRGAATGTFQITIPGCRGGPPEAWSVKLVRPASAPLPAVGTASGFTVSEGPPQPPPQPRQVHVAPVVNYVALGDSISAGHGVLPYDPGTDVPSGRDRDLCHRSRYAYPRVLTLPQVRLRRSFFACAGATAPNLTLRTQWPGEGRPQLLHFRALRAADLVTVTIGANDVRFDRVLTECTRMSGSCSKPGERAGILQAARGLQSTLVATYKDILAAAPPTAAVLVLGYPQVFPAGGLPIRCVPDAQLWRPDAQRFLRHADDVLRDTIASAARQAGVQFIDIIPAFTGHEICGRDGGWINHLTVIPQGSNPPIAAEQSFHPTRAGQAAYARAIERYVRHRIAAGAPLTPKGLPKNPAPSP